MEPHPALDPFCPAVRAWFAERLGTPTAVQAAAWPHIAAGEHVLATAPTGSGKTLTAFLWALDRLLTGTWEGGATRVLYVSPLKALGTDVRRNLLEPLAELTGRLALAGLEPPPVQVMTRSGDTPQEERRRMIRRPPEILITTPESLNILLTSRSGQLLLSELRTVILDEVHSVVGSKRGVHLITAVERLAVAAGELQRVALSATVRPLERVAAWVGGQVLEHGPDQGGRQRPVAIVAPAERKSTRLEVRFPVAASGERRHSGSLWERLIEDLRRTIELSTSTLIFGNSRRMVEKVARLINEPLAEPIAYSHHGALSREVRSVVEQRLKAGELRAIVATSSLELGIDIGTIDHVALVMAPPSVASTVQRLGRAGHSVGATSCGTLYPLHPRDLLQCAVLARAALDGDIEPIRPVGAALDVLAQVILSMTAHETWPIDELLSVIRRADPYRDLSRRHFDLVLEMLAGRYASTRVRALRPLIAIDRLDGTVRARPGADRLLYMSGGTIADRGYYTLRLEESGSPLGELDEEFVWERSVGDTFTLGVQTWRIQRITHNDVVVVPARARSAMPPFWRADEQDRSCFLSDRVAELLEAMEPHLGEPSTADGRAAGLIDELVTRHCLQPDAAAELVAHLREQARATHGLPHRHRVVVERTAATSGRGDARHILLHTFWGGSVNRPLALALAAAWESRFGVRPEVVHDDDCVVLTHPADMVVDDPLALVPPDAIEHLLHSSLEQTGFFGACFRQAAGCAMLLPRAGLRRRTPLWLNRQRAKELLQAVSGAGDFPLVIEAWRTCLHDHFELDALAAKLHEVREHTIEVLDVQTETPSPFAAGVLWRQTNILMYETDASAARQGPAIGGDLIRELVTSSRLRPRLARELVSQLEAKLQRTAEGYAPPSAAELLHWIEERVMIPAQEWPELLQAMARDHALEPARLLAELGPKVILLRPLGAPAGGLIVAVQALPRLLKALGRDLDELELAAPALSNCIDSIDGIDGIDGSTSESATPSVSSVLRQVLAELARSEGSHERDTGDTGNTSDTSDTENGGLAELLGEWLRFYGPLELERISRMWCLPETELKPAIAALVESGTVVVDEITDEITAEITDEITDRAAVDQVCDIENLERLLRLLRREARVELEPLPAESLHLLLLQQQGATSADPHRPTARPAEQLQQCLEPLLGLSLPVSMWETEVLPARVDPYQTAWLDTLLTETDLQWLGTGTKRVSFVLADERELLAVPPDRSGANAVAPSERHEPGPTAVTTRGTRSSSTDESPDEDAAKNAAENATEDHVEAMFPGYLGRSTLEDLVARTGLESAQLTRLLWQLAWQGRVSSDSFAPVRQALAGGFTPRPVPAEPRTLRRRGRFDRWRSTRAFQGVWYALEPAVPDDDLLAREESGRERARLLLDRYGVVFRELLERELPPLRWSAVFRSLRLMELSGEVVSGRFVEGVAGLQLASHATVRRLEAGLDPELVWWMNAADPASPCGLQLIGLDPDLPRRVATSHLAGRGAQVVVISERQAKQLTIRTGPDDPLLGEYLRFLTVALTRQVSPRKAVLVETINDEPAAASPLRPALARLFSVSGTTRGLRLARRY